MLIYFHCKFIKYKYQAHPKVKIICNQTIGIKKQFIQITWIDISFKFHKITDKKINNETILLIKFFLNLDI